MFKQSGKIFNNKNRWTYYLRIFNVNYIDFDNIEKKKYSLIRGKDCMKDWINSERNYKTIRQQNYYDKYLWNKSK